MLIKRGQHVVCKKCNNTQIVTDDNIYQDIYGKSVICEKCHALTNVEVEEDEY